jgi:hypothetical protein
VQQKPPPAQQQQRPTKEWDAKTAPEPSVRAVTRSTTPNAEEEERWALDLFSGTGSVKKALKEMG